MSLSTHSITSHHVSAHSQHAPKNHTYHDIKSAAKQRLEEKTGMVRANYIRPPDRKERSGQ